MKYMEIYGIIVIGNLWKSSILYMSSVGNAPPISAEWPNGPELQ